MSTKSEIEMMLRQYEELTGDEMTLTGKCLQAPGIHRHLSTSRLLHAWLSGAVAALEQQYYKRDKQKRESR